MSVSTNQEVVMGKAIPSQHPAVVLRSHFNQLRAMLAIAMVAVVGLTVAVVALAINDDSSTSPAATVTPSGQAAEGPRQIHSPGQRYDGGPDEGTRGPRGIVASPAPDTRYDGGPDEGTRGPRAR
jgi:hypothetical protein